ncbi:MAG: tetratricopeptide repeat protein [Candidatus Eisenbacteria bacterium]|uniref:Tetratricopeptide repeat protein n=1 Tax=Eiseniibacteriota bacterium TaxID=2212470 RepID=A0A7Y2E6K1_UNCEI|nr:tetratricopeptide repeat protein [Candidatus Eisenbacteria bacterium]
MPPSDAYFVQRRSWQESVFPSYFGSGFEDASLASGSRDLNLLRMPDAGPYGVRLIAWEGLQPLTPPTPMTSLPVVAAKLARPQLHQVFPRPILVQELLDGVDQHPLTLVSAKPGYGKTTLLATFANQYKPGVIWYSLGPDDADLSVFLRHLAAGMAGFSRRFGKTLQAFINEGQITERSAGTAAGAFLNDLTRVKQPVGFVLDDYHAVGDNPAINRFLNTVLENLSSQIRIVVASRTEPPLALAKLRARRQLFEFQAEDLAFSREEVRSLLREVYDRDPQEEALDEILRSTEGWAAAVYLLLASDPNRKGVKLPAAVRSATVPGSAIHDYFAEEILNQQTGEVRKWLLRTSVFDALTPEILHQVFADLDVDTMLHELTRRRLVASFESTDGVAYRYHALLASFFRKRFRIEIPAAEREAIHQKAADVYAERGELASAARQLADSGNTNLLADFLKSHGLRLIDQGHYQLLLGWFESLPTNLKDNDPWLRLRLGDVRHFLGDWPGAELEYERARVLLETREDPDAEAWATLGLARIWNLRGQAELVASEAGETLQRMESRKDPRTPVRSELILRLLQVVSGAKFYLGEYTEALSLLDRLANQVKANPERQAAVWNNRAVVHASRGDYPAAVKAFENGLERPGVRRSPRVALHLSNLALLHSEMGDTERALALFREAEELAESFRNRSQLLTCHVGQARLFYLRRETERALECLKKAEAINEDLKFPIMTAEALALRAKILSDAGQYAAARNKLSLALASYGAASRDANWLLYRIDAAVVDLRAGRIEEAESALDELESLSHDLEALFPRALLAFYLGECRRRLGKTDKAIKVLETALIDSRELGYDAAIRSEMLRSFEPFTLLLEKGKCIEPIHHLASGLGSEIEKELLPLLDRGDFPAASVESILSILSEVGGPEAYTKLKGSDWAKHPELGSSVQSALDTLQECYPELQADNGSERKIRVRTLGKFELVAYGDPVGLAPWKSQRALAIFVYLAVRGSRGESKDRMIDQFWPQTAARKAEKNFHPTLSYVRGALKKIGIEATLELTHGRYRLDTEDTLEVDVLEFQSAVSRAEGASTSEEKMRHLTRAIELYQGDFMGDRYDPWAEDIRSQLSMQMENALEEAATLSMAEDRLEYARSCLISVLEKNPYREEIHCHLMTCYHRMGDRKAVREQFESLKSLLRKELSVDPLDETLALFESLMISP